MILPRLLMQVVLAFDAGLRWPDYSAQPAARGLTCSADPTIADALLRQGQRLGIAVVAGPPELPGRHASYRALPGRLGTITLKQRPMSAEVRCLLISHEFIHVLRLLQATPTQTGSSRPSLR